MIYAIRTDAIYFRAPGTVIRSLNGQKKLRQSSYDVRGKKKEERREGL